MEEAAYIDGASRSRFLWQVLFPLVCCKPDDPDRGGVMAASTVMTIPVLVFCVLVQRRLVSGLGEAVKD